MNRHGRFLGDFTVNFGTVSAKYSVAVPEVKSTFDDIPQYRDGMFVDLPALGAKVEQVFTDALAYANPNLIVLNDMGAQARVDFFKRLQWFLKNNTPPELFASLVDREHPFNINFFGKEEMTVTNTAANDWAYEYSPYTIPLRDPTLDTALGKGKFGTSAGLLPEHVKGLKAFIHDALTQTVQVFRSQVPARRWASTDLWAEDQAAWSFMTQYGDRIGVAPPPVYPYISESGSDNFARNAFNRKLWRENVLKRGEAILAGIDPATVPVTDYMPFDAPKKGSEYYANLLGTVATAAFMAWGTAAVIGQAIPNNFGWLQNQWQTRVVQPLEQLVTNPLGAVKEAIAKPLETVKGAIADPIGTAQTAATEYVQKKVAQVIGPYGRVLEIVVDPAGFVRDKLTNEILYPLQNPGDWLIDEARKQVRNKVTGEIRDLVTGAVIGYLQPDGSVVAAVPDAQPAQTVPVANTMQTTGAKPFPWRLVLLGATAVWSLLS